MPDTLLTVAHLASLPVLAWLTQAIVEQLAPLLDRKIHIPTLNLAWFVAAALVLLSQLAGGADPADWTLYFLAPLSGIVVAYAAGKLHDQAKARSSNGK